MKKKEGNTAPTVNLFKTLSKMDDGVEILEKSSFSNINEWIPSGNYILNACLSGDLFKAAPTGRITFLAGESGTGKSYLACSMCREAQLKGYTPVYLDSENAIDSEFVKRLGCDPSNFLIKQVSTIKETTTFIINMCRQIEEQVEAGATPPKVILVLDSLGQLSSEKEIDDAVSGHQAADFTKAKDTKALFRVVSIPLSRLQIPFVITNHVYTNIGSFVGGTIMSNGSGAKYAGSVTLNLASIAKLTDKENDKAAGKNAGSDLVKKNGVLITAWPDKSRFCIPHKVKFQIPFYKAPNPYVGLEDYLNWDNAGVMQGKCYTQEEYDKLPAADQIEAGKYEFDFEGEKRYALPKKTLVRGVGIVCKHLGKAVALPEFFSKETFTDEFLNKINDEIIHPLFCLPSTNSFADIEDIKNDLNMTEESDEDADEDSSELISTKI